MRALIWRHVLCVARGMFVRYQEEPASAGRWVDDGVCRCRVNAVDDRVDQRARREVLARARLDVFGAFAQQLLVRVAFDVDARGRPVLLVDEVDDEAFELGRILNPILRLTKNDTQGAGLPREIFKHVAIGDLQLVAISVEEALPRTVGWHDSLGLQWPNL